MLIVGIGDEVLLLLISLTALVLVTIGTRWIRTRGRSNLEEQAILAELRALRHHKQEQKIEQEQGKAKESVECPICLQNVYLATETSCGHCYCGECILTFWKRLGTGKPLTCAVCRSSIRFLVSSFTMRSLFKDNIQRKQLQLSERSEREVDSEIQLYNTLFEGSGKSHWTQAMNLYRNFNHLTVFAKLTVVLVLVFVVAYILSPLDLLPESALGVWGLIDDIVVLFMFIMLMAFYYRFLTLRLQHLQNLV